MSELIPPSETSEPIPIRTGTITADHQQEVVRLGSARGGWWRQVGWRHLVAWVALFFGLFPILFLISAAINPLGTLSTSTLIPKGASLENFSKLFANTE
jgi:arabinogalactan oligomer/maltooligosaccharide transport system permease protein